MTLLLRLCDSVAPLVLILRTSVEKTNLFGYISQIQNIFVLFNSSSIGGVMMKTFEISILRAFYFSLTCPTSASSSSHPTHSLITRMTLGSLNSDIPESQFVTVLLYI